jgi:acyl carrier protein
MIEFKDPAQIQSRVRQTVALVLALPADSIQPHSRILLDLNAESLDLLDLRFRLEEEFAIRIEQEDLSQAFGSGLTREDFAERFTLQSLSDYVRARLGG